MLEHVTQQRSGQAKDTRSFASAGRASDNNIGHVSILRDHPEPADGFFVADHISDILRAILFDPPGQRAAFTVVKGGTWQGLSVWHPTEGFRYLL
jgi:hypothetical protein